MRVSFRFWGARAGARLQHVRDARLGQRAAIHLRNHGADVEAGRQLHGRVVHQLLILPVLALVVVALVAVTVAGRAGRRAGAGGAAAAAVQRAAAVVAAAVRHAHAAHAGHAVQRWRRGRRGRRGRRRGAAAGAAREAPGGGRAALRHLIAAWGHASAGIRWVRPVLGECTWWALLCCVRRPFVGPCNAANSAPLLARAHNPAVAAAGAAGGTNGGAGKPALSPLRDCGAPRARAPAPVAPIEVAVLPEKVLVVGLQVGGRAAALGSADSLRSAHFSELCPPADAVLSQRAPTAASS